MMSTEVCKFDKDLCRCCHSEGKFRNIYSPQYSMEVEEEKTKMCVCISPVVYADMLRECYNIELLPVTEPYKEMVSAICTGCIQKLRDANNFKRQVQKCEDEFRKQYYQHVMKDSDVKVNIKLEVIEVSNDDQTAMTNDDDHRLADDDHRMVDDDHGIVDDQRMRNYRDLKLKVEVSAADGGTIADDDDVNDRLTITRQVSVKESKPSNEEENVTVSLKNKKKRKATKQNLPTPVIKANRKVGRPRKKVAVSAKEEEIEDATKDSIISKPLTLCMLQKDVDYKRARDYVQCTRCEMKLKNIDCLRNHVKHIHMKLPRFTCIICSQTFHTLSHMSKHKRDKHDIDDRLQCKICKEKFNRSNKLRRHMSKFHSGVEGVPTSRYRLKQKKTPNTSSKIKTEIKVDPSDSVADFEDEELDTLQETIKIVKRPPPAFRMLEDVHYKRIGDLVQCCRCEKTASNVNNLRVHVKFTHLNLPKHTCSVCSLTFRSTSSFTIHKYKEHNIDDRAKCNACDSTFNTRHQLSHHIKCFHMLGEKYKCDECTYECFSATNLHRHKLNHKAVKEFQCKYCLKAFKRRTTLQFHERIHTGDKRKVCKECGEAFVQKASLNYHMAKYHPGVDF